MSPWITLSSDARRREGLGFWLDGAAELLRDISFRSVAMLRRGVFEDVEVEG